MMKYFLTIAFVSLFAIGLQAQVRNSLGLGGGLAYPPFGKIYNMGWYTSLQWNIGVGRSSFIDTHISLTKIGLKDYPVGPGVGNVDNFYQLGVGFRQYFGKQFFAQGGLAAMLIDHGDESIRFVPNVNIGYDLFLTERQSVEFSLKTEFIKQFDYFDPHKNVSVFSLGAAYKFWYFNK